MRQVVSWSSPKSTKVSPWDAPAPKMNTVLSILSLRYMRKPNRPSLHGQRHLREIFRQISTMLHRFALAPRDHVNGIDSRRQRDFVPAGRIHAVLVADVLLIFGHELDVFAARVLLIKDDADEIDAHRRRVLEEHIETRM